MLNREPPIAEPFHPAVAGVLRFFEADHLPEGRIRGTAMLMRDIAYTLARNIAPDPELTVALRRLLDAKDAAVRAAVVEEKARRGVATIVNPSELAPVPSAADPAIIREQMNP